MPLPKRQSELRTKLTPAVVPTAASLALHTALLLLVLTVTLTVTTRTQRGSGDIGPAISLADPVHDPIEVDERRTPWTGPTTPFEPPPPAVRKPRSELGRIARPVDSIELRAASRADERRPLDELTSAEHAAGRSATFAGMKATRVASVVYVVDTSGAMVNSMSFVIRELRRSVERLSVRQSFQVVLFGKRSESELYRTLPGRPELVLATPNEIDRADMWLDDVYAGGRSNPLDGLRRALEYRPDVVFLLSRSIKRTGVGAQWGRGKDAILAELDRLNPIDEQTGRRPVVIKTIQFIDSDPTGIMRAIGERHGDPRDPQSHAVLTLNDLVERSREQEQVSLETPELDEAAGVLAELASDGSDTAVLFGVPRDDQRYTVAKAASRAAGLIEQAERRGLGAQDRDLRVPFLRAKAQILLAAISENDDRRAVQASAAVDALEGMSLDVELLERARLVALGTAYMLRGDDEQAYPVFDALASASVKHAEVDPFTTAEAWFGLVFTAPDSAAAIDAVERLHDAMRREPFVVDGRVDAALIVAATDAITRGLVERGDKSLLATAFAQQVELLNDERLGLDARTRRSLVFHRISVLSDEHMPFEELPAVVAFGRAAVLANDYEHLDEAVRLFDLAAELSDDDDLTFEALWESAVLLIESPEPDSNLGASARLYRLAAIDPRATRSLDAILASLDLARAYDDASHAREQYLDTLTFALDTFPALPARNSWLLECARVHLLVGDVPSGLDRLAMISANTPEGASARKIFVEVSGGTLDRLAEQLAAGTPGDGVLTEYLAVSQRAAGFAVQYGLPEVDRFRADHADALLENGSPEALPIFADLLPSAAGVPGGEVRIRLGLARALLLDGRTRRAFEELRELIAMLDGVEPRPRAFWHAWTLSLEVIAERGADDSRAGRVGAHIARLRAIDATLGGKPWRTRIEAVERALR
jgi:hypothetical protein